MSLQNYVSRKESSTRNIFVCPLKDRCGCSVEFRVSATDDVIQLEAEGEHTAESHFQDNVSKVLTIQQSSALEQTVSYQMVSSTSVRCGLQLLPDSASKTCPSKARLVARAVSAARVQVLQPFSQGEEP